MAHSTTLRLGLLALAFATALHAAPPAEITAAAPLFPENTKAVVAMHLTAEAREWIFSSFFLNPAVYKRVITEQSEKFAKATGFNPLDDVEWDIIALSDSPSASVLIAIPKKDPTKMLAELLKDPRSAPLLKTEVIKGTTVVRLDRMEIAFQPKLIAVAPPGMLKPILERAAESPSNAKFLEQISAPAVTTAAVYGFAAPAPETMANIAQQPNVQKFGGAVLGRVKQVGVSMNATELAVVLKLDSKDAAIVAGDQLKGLITSAKGVIVPATVKPAVPEDASPFQHIDPKIVLARLAALSGNDALNALVVTTDDETTRVAIPKDKVPLMRAEGSTLFIAAAAIVGAAYGTLSKAGIPGMPGNAPSDAETASQCYAVQQRLSAAVELYNTDKKKKAHLEEVADALVQAQYLEAKPDDPGQAAGSFTHYFTAPDGRVSCKIHGSPDAGEPNDSERAAPDRKASPAPSATPADDEGESER